MFNSPLPGDRPINVLLSLTIQIVPEQVVKVPLLSFLDADYLGKEDHRLTFKDVVLGRNAGGGYLGILHHGLVELPALSTEPPAVAFPGVITGNTGQWFDDIPEFLIIVHAEVIPHDFVESSELRQLPMIEHFLQHAVESLHGRGVLAALLDVHPKFVPRHRHHDIISAAERLPSPAGPPGAASCRAKPEWRPGQVQGIVMPRSLSQSPRFRRVTPLSSVAKKHHLPGGGFGNVPLTSLMMASPRRIADAVVMYGSPRAKQRPSSPSIICQDCISSAGILSRLDNASHACRASPVNVASCSTDHDPSRNNPRSPHT